jgi:hypothetical protein
MKGNEFLKKLKALAERKGGLMNGVPMKVRGVTVRCM